MRARPSHPTNACALNNSQQRSEALIPAPKASGRKRLGSHPAAILRMNICDSSARIAPPRHVPGSAAMFLCWSDGAGHWDRLRNTVAGTFRNDVVDVWLRLPVQQ